MSSTQSSRSVAIELPADILRMLMDAAILVRDGAECDEHETRMLDVAINLIDRALDGHA